jgi:YidC/Oxa1 family membrane protein insertase
MLDNYRLILSIIVATLGVMIWSSWNTRTMETGSGNQGLAVAQPREINKNSEIPAVKSNSVEKSSAENVSLFNNSDKNISIETDLISATISPVGGTLVKLSLKKYPLSDEDKDEPFPLLDITSQHYFVIQTGLLGKDSAPNHKTIFNSEKQSYTLEDDQQELRVKLVYRDDAIKVEKIYVFKNSTYEIEFSQIVTNESNESLNLREYRQLVRNKPEDSESNAFIYTYTGGAIYSPEEKYTKIDFDSMSEMDLSKDIKAGWLAMLQHYFMAALIPDPDDNYHYYTKKLSASKFILGAYTSPFSIPGNEAIEFTGKYWVGPKLQETLSDTAVGLDLTTDYGWLTVIAKPLFWILKFIHDVVGNWGWSIVILTILIKLAFYKLSAASYRSMAGMRQLTPRIQQIKERYGDDKEKFNKAMMEIYQKEKINPVGGCLPILVQIPVFIALYWVLLETVELRGAPFILWIDNLATKDPFFILPVVMGISMFIQQKLNPAPPDPMQAKIMMSLPFVFTVFFAFFPSGLVLYWVVNNILSILQQWKITTALESKAK